MNKNLLKLFSLVVLSFPALGEKNSDNLKLIGLLPKGVIKTYCENNSGDSDCNILFNLLWTAVNAEKYDEMPRAKRIVHNKINRFVVRELPIDKSAIYNWKEDDFKFLTTLLREMFLKKIRLFDEETGEKMPLSVKKISNEMAKVVGKFIEFENLEKEAKKIKKETIEKRNSPTDRIIKGEA